MDAIRSFDAKLVEQSKENIVQNNDHIFEMVAKSAKRPIRLFVSVLFCITALTTILYYTGAFSYQFLSIKEVINEFLGDSGTIIFIMAMPIAVIFAMAGLSLHSLISIKIEGLSLTTKTQWQSHLKQPGDTIHFTHWDDVQNIDYTTAARGMFIKINQPNNQRYSIYLDALVFGPFSLEELKKWIDRKKSKTSTYEEL